MTTIDQALLWRIADGQASDAEIMAAYDHAILVINRQVTRRANLDRADPLLNEDDLRQEAWLKFIGWCKSFPRDGRMTPDQWFRCCWRNVSINLSVAMQRRRPREWPSLEGMEEKQMEENGIIHDSGIEMPPNLDEIWRDLCSIIDKTPMTPSHKKRLQRFVAYRLAGYSVPEATRLLRYTTDPNGELFRKAELCIYEKYLGHKPLSR